MLTFPIAHHDPLHTPTLHTETCKFADFIETCAVVLTGITETFVNLSLTSLTFPTIVTYTVKRSGCVHTGTCNQQIKLNTR